jgi:bifunctional non-homologous end joining protein LigD
MVVPDPAEVEARRARLTPMLAAVGELPADDAAYGFEEKWDGLRALAFLIEGTLRLVNRNGVDVTTVYPELAPLAGALGGVDAVLDGEIVATDADGRVSFETLQHRFHQRDPRVIARLAAANPASYRIFDLLDLDGLDTTALAYAQRRELLEALELDGSNWQTPPYTRGGGAERLAEAARAGVEGVVAKRLDSPYRVGRRTTDWLKIKNVVAQEVVIGGWRPGAGNRAGTIGSLLLGIPGPDGLVYVGHVGTGFTRRALDDLLGLLTARARPTSPFASALPAHHARHARWVTPDLVGEVAYAELTREGRLRQASWRGLRPDKRPQDVVVESAG